MKNNIIKYYSDLVNDMSIAHDNIVNDLRFHINLLEKRVLELEGRNVDKALNEYDELESSDLVEENKKTQKRIAVVED